VRSFVWEGEAFLDKPFTPKGLLEAVSLLLTGRLDPNAPVPTVPATAKEEQRRDGILDTLLRPLRAWSGK
jgi:hypothetical protein